MTKNRGACALTRAGGTLYTIKLKSACRKPDPSLAGLDPVPLSEIGTRLLASLGSKVKNRNPLVCLRNAGSYFVVKYFSALSCVENTKLFHGAAAEVAREACTHKDVCIMLTQVTF